MRVARVVPLMLATVMAACGDDPTATESLIAARNSAFATWTVSRPGSYSFEAFRSCECLSDAVGPVVITVTSAQLTSVVRKDNGAAVDPSYWFTLDQLFGLIDTEVVSRPSRLEARYDATFGFPVYVAYGEREVDAGAEITVSAFATRN